MGEGQLGHLVHRSPGCCATCSSANSCAGLSAPRPVSRVPARKAWTIRRKAVEDGAHIRVRIRSGALAGHGPILACPDRQAHDHGSFDGVDIYGIPYTCDRTIRLNDVPDIAEELGDFTTTSRTLLISVIAVALGFMSAYLALALLALIERCTNLFFFLRYSRAPVSPAANALGPWAIAVPVAGALVIGVMARYGSERIRGHGIPEAIEAI